MNASQQAFNQSDARNDRRRQRFFWAPTSWHVQIRELRINTAGSRQGRGLRRAELRRDEQVLEHGNTPGPFTKASFALNPCQMVPDLLRQEASPYLRDELGKLPGKSWF
jgi:hypothetical protein